MVKFFITFILLVSVLYSSEKIVKIGVLAKRGEAIALKKWEPTSNYLTHHLHGYKFKIIPLSFEHIFKAVEKQEISFILANPGFYVELEHKFGVQRISTLVNKHISGISQKQFGGVIFTHIDNKERFKSFDSLVDVRFAAVNEKSLGGWQMAWRELKENGIDVKSDFKSLDFKGTHDKVVKSVLKKEVDVGTVRTDTLERMAYEGKINLKNIYLINQIKYDKFPFMSSTRLYPEWPISKLKHTNDTLAKKVAIALMQMKPVDTAAVSANIEGWDTPLNYQPVHDCFKTLEIPPYYHPIKMIDVIKKYWGWILFYLAGGIAGISMLVYQIRLTKHLQNTQDELVQTEKMASLGRLVAGVAHEINTPIGVSVTAASHLNKETKNFKKDYKNEAVTQKSFENFIATSVQSSDIILKNLERAADMVQNFKQISVDQSSDEVRDFYLEEYLQSIIESLKPAIKNLKNDVRLICDPNIKIESNPGVFSQIFSNLIINSVIHGFENKSDGQISIEVRQHQKELQIIYKDNGKGVSKENLSKLFDPFFTTKRGKGGSGLGTHIVYNLVTQKLNGTIEVDSELGSGLTFNMHFKGVKFV